MPARAAAFVQAETDRRARTVGQDLVVREARERTRAASVPPARHLTLSRARIKLFGQRRSAAAKKWQLTIGVGQCDMEVRNGDTQQPDTLVGRQQHAHEFNACPTEQIAAHDCPRETPAAGDLVEIGELHLHRNRPGESFCFVAPGPDIVGHGFDAGLDFGGRRQVTLEGGFRS